MTDGNIKVINNTKLYVFALNIWGQQFGTYSRITLLWTLSKQNNSRIFTSSVRGKLNSDINICQLETALPCSCSVFRQWRNIFARHLFQKTHYMFKILVEITTHLLYLLMAVIIILKIHGNIT